MPKQKKDIFKIATQTLKKNKILQSLILSSLIISNTPLIAENTENKTPQTIENEQTYELNIVCDEEYVAEAEKLKSQIDKLQTKNKYAEFIISELAKNNTKIKITKTNNINLYYNNVMYINGEQIKEAISEYDKNSLNESVIHEAIHMLQNKDNIMDDIEKLPPKEAICLYLYAELDATVKSYISCDNYYETETEKKATSSLNAISNIISYAMNSYIEKAIYLNTNKDYIPTPPTTESIINKFNSMGNLPKLNLDNIIKTIYEKIPTEYKTQIENLNKEYLAKGNILLTQKDTIQK